MEVIDVLLSSVANSLASTWSHLLFSNTVCSTMNNCNMMYGCILQNLCTLSTCSEKHISFMSVIYQLSCWSIFNTIRCRCVLPQYVTVSVVDLYANSLYICELFKFGNLLKTKFVSLYIPLVTVWVKIAAPNCHGKSRYVCDMKWFSVTIETTAGWLQHRSPHTLGV